MTRPQLTRSTAIAAALALCACATLYALPSALADEHAHHAGRTLWGLNWWSTTDHRSPLGYFLIDFGLFVLVLVALTRTPLSRAFAERHDHIRRAIADAAAAHAKATSAQQDARRALSNLEQEIRQLEEQSRRDGEAERQQLIDDASERIAEADRETTLQGEQEQSRLFERLRRRALTDIVAAAEKKLTDELTDDDCTRLLERALEELGTLPLESAPPKHSAARESLSHP